MRVVSLPQPAATLTITRMVCETCGGSGTVVEQHDYASEPLGCPDCLGGTDAPMVSRWVTFDFACPEGVVETRIAIAATNDEPAHEMRVGGYEVWHLDGRIVLSDGLVTWPLLLGVVVGSAKVAASYPIVGEHDNPLPKPWIERTDQDLLHLVRWDGWTDISDQLPYNDWSPGRFAWLLTDAAPCQERCPRCLGVSRYPMYCDLCDDKGHCEPVPWVSSGGRLPEWQPGDGH